MRKLVSVYNRFFTHLNSTGPNDPCATVYWADENAAYPERLVKADAVRFLATEAGGIVWAENFVRQSISRDGFTLKPELLANLWRCAREIDLVHLESLLKG